MQRVPSFGTCVPRLGAGDTCSFRAAGGRPGSGKGASANLVLLECGTVELPFQAKPKKKKKPKVHNFRIFGASELTFGCAAGEEDERPAARPKSRPEGSES